MVWWFIPAIAAGLITAAKVGSRGARSASRSSRGSASSAKTASGSSGVRSTSVVGSVASRGSAYGSARSGSSQSRIRGPPLPFTAGDLSVQFARNRSRGRYQRRRGRGRRNTRGDAVPLVVGSRLQSGSAAAAESSADVLRRQAALGRELNVLRTARPPRERGPTGPPTRANLRARGRNNNLGKVSRRQRIKDALKSGAILATAGGLLSAPAWLPLAVGTHSEAAAPLSTEPEEGRTPLIQIGGVTNYDPGTKPEFRVFSANDLMELEKLTQLYSNWHSRRFLITAYDYWNTTHNVVLATVVPSGLPNRRGKNINSIGFALRGTVIETPVGVQQHPLQHFMALVYDNSPDRGVATTPIISDIYDIDANGFGAIHNQYAHRYTELRRFDFTLYSLNSCTFNIFVDTEMLPSSWKEGSGVAVNDMRDGAVYIVFYGQQEPGGYATADFRVDHYYTDN